MESSSALQRLVNILENADSTAKKIRKNHPDKEVRAIEALVSAMGFSSWEPQYIFELYSLTSEAFKEAERLDKVRTKKHYGRLLEDIVDFFGSPGFYSITWHTFQEELLNKRILVSLDSLAESYSNQFPKAVVLNKNALDIIYTKFSKLSKDVTESDLPDNLKSFLFEAIERMLSELRRYNLDGTEGLQRVSKDLISDWLTIAPKIPENEVKKPIMKRTLSWFGVLNSFLGVNLLALMDVVPAYFPTIEKLMEVQEIIEAKSINRTLSLQEIICEATDLFNEKDIKALEGVREPKALPPGEDIETEGE